MQTQLEKNKAAVIRFNKAFLEKGDVQAFEEIVAPDFINHTAASVGQPSGREGVLNFIKNILHVAVTDIRVEIYDQVAEGDTVVTRKAIIGKQVGELLGKPATGQQITMHIIDIIRLRDGRYTEHWSLRSMQ
ncbi:MAG TPA: ester cyclase [Chitinophaga sp.]|uniref:ester cyclase n=1 Tax=Chitinophaga sp. TaxID=1869181 RepID=UPI002DB57B0D|nr:ester cyclase [Chitinophaga sp.]HEU4551809.1 ester cyclase [Chitinophaga sp.]